MKIKKAIIICILAIPMAASAQKKNNDFGIWTTVGAEKEIDKKLTVGIEAEFRTRNNSKTADRWSGAISTDYKLLPWLKLGAGYKFIYNKNYEKTTYHADGSLNNFRPSYWGTRHRFHVDITGTLKLDRIDFSLRERWQYTYRPEQSTTRYDYDNNWWEDTDVSSKSSHVLRSRFQVKYNIPKSKITPFANVELYNNWSLEKMRYTIGADWKVAKQHEVSVFYRYQHEKNADVSNKHILGLGYIFKF